MQEVRTVVSEARNRLAVNEFLRALVMTSTASVGALALVVVAERALGMMVPWRDVVAWTAGGVLAASLAWALARRPGLLDAARALDQAADLRESMSTALVVERSPDPWAGAVVESARQRARRVVVRRVMPIRGPDWWWSPVVAGAAMLIAWLAMPHLDLLGRLARREAGEEARRRVVEVQADLQAREQRLAEAIARAGLDPGKELDAPEPTDETPRPEEIERAAIRRLTSLNERLEELRQGEKARQFESLREAMQQLRQPGPGPLQEMARHLSMGNFARAEQALSELARQVESGQVTAEQREQLARQLENLARQLRDVSGRSEALEQALVKSGLDPEKAAELARRMIADPDAAREMLDQVPSLSPEQRRELKDLGKGISQSAGRSNSLSRALSDLASGLGPGQNSPGRLDPDALAAAGEMLSEMEMLSQEMDGLEAALDEVEAQLASLCEGGKGGSCEGDLMMAQEARIGEWEEGESDTTGVGSGAAGKGLGPSTADSPAEFKVDRTRQRVGGRGGSIIASRLVFGEAVRGESVAELAEAVESGTRSAAEALESNVIPRELHGAVKHYFGRLESRVKARPAPPEGAEGAPR